MDEIPLCPHQASPFDLTRTFNTLMLNCLGFSHYRSEITMNKCRYGDDCHKAVFVSVLTNGSKWKKQIEAIGWQRDMSPFDGACVAELLTFLQLGRKWMDEWMLKGP